MQDLLLTALWKQEHIQSQSDSPLKRHIADNDLVADCLDDGLSPTCSRMISNETKARMKFENKRLASFQDWPHWAPVIARDLARQGFFYLFVGDRVRCAFCGVERENWSHSDIPYVIHWTLAHARCPFLRGENVGNVPIEDDFDVSEVSRSLREDDRTMPFLRNTALNSTAVRCGHGSSEVSCLRCTTQLSGSKTPTHFATEVPSADKMAAKTHRPWTDLLRTARYPRMASFKARLSTFDKWPLLQPTPKELARAGLYHVGKPFTAPTYLPQQESAEAQRTEPYDSVKCFWCGGRLHRWRSTDDPVLEHARHFPHCRFIRNLIGDDLLEEILQAASTTQHGESSTQRLSLHPSTLATGATPGDDNDDWRWNPAVDSVLQMGFSPRLIKDLVTRSATPLDAETLCNLALQTALDHNSSTRNTGPGPHNTSIENWNSPARHGQGVKPAPSHVTLRAESGSPNEKLLCKVCKHAEVKMTLLPCGHLACCQVCAAACHYCPVCLNRIEDKIAVFLS